jgi:hypothetical protein
MRPVLSTAHRPRRGASGWPWRATLALALATAPADARAGSPGSVDFSRDVLPILSGNCFLCHGPDAHARKGDLRLDIKAGALRDKDPVIVPGKSDESEFVRRVTSDDPDERMPPPKSGKTLTPAQVELLKRWVDQGAKWGKHWAFETPRRPEPPRVRDDRWPRNPIDRFVLARLEAQGLNPAPEADKATLIRRVSLDLTGLPPSLKELDAFLADDAPGTYERLVDRLLASPRYGERMAMDWLDDARYADTNGYQNDFARTMWPWRDWVIGAFNRNQPFDRFAVEQVAGDLLPGATLAQKIATGFNRNNRTVTEAGSIDEEWRVENAVDRVETTATVFLGLTMGCARCHDHKYDPVTQKEFYKFFGFFNSVNEKGVYTEQRGNVPPLVAVPSRADEERLGRLSAEIAAAEKAVRDQEADLPGRQKAWEQEQQERTLPPEPRDWALRCPLDGNLRVSGPGDETGEVVARGDGQPAWSDGPTGKALKLAGKPGAFVEARSAVSPDRADRFSYGGWVRPRGDGAVLTKMDDRAAFRGFDLLVNQLKLSVHLVHAWPGDAIKVTTREALMKDAWAHVFVTYDGSGKASGVKVYLNGRPAAVDVQGDSLRGAITTDQPLRLGSRSTSSPLNGDLADLRVYRRALAADEVQAVADRPALQVARMPRDERSKVQQERLARSYRDHFAAGLREADDRLARLRKEKAEAEKRVPTVMVMEDLPKPREMFVLKRGRYDMPDKGQKVEPGVPECLTALPSDASRNRHGLARWLVAADNPLTARVTVNRVWQHHFGTGLVKTAENLGLQSEPPSHPELLDWLATELIRTGWDLKALHKQIVTSAAYRQSSKAAPALLHRDPENRLLARGPRFRLAAEVVRDNALAVAGLLVERVGGPSIKPYQPAGLWEELAGGAGEGPYVQDKGPDLYRRSLYIYRKRTVPHPALANFDAPSREVCQVKRPRTNTPLQALELLNDVTYVEAARALAQRMLNEGGPTPDERIAFAFRRATGRTPGASELAVVRRGLDRYRKSFSDREEALRLIRHGESPVPASLDPAELAAYTAAAGVILNLDETITLE